MKRKKGIMNWRLFENLIDKFDDNSGGDINLTGIVGEPLIDEDIVEKIKYARTKKKIRNIRFSTNGILLQKTGIKKLLKSGVDSILINIGGMDEETYKSLFGVDKFYEVYENIQKLLSINKSIDRAVELIIVVKVISLDDVLTNKRYLLLKEFSKTCAAKIVFDYTYDSWCGRISKDDMAGDMKLKLNRKKRVPCSLLYSSLTIMWNGDVVPCCRDLDGDIVLGNIIEQSTDEIWKSDAFEKVRKSFTQGNIPSICNKCGHYEGLSPLKNVHLLKQSFLLKRK